MTETEILRLLFLLALLSYLLPAVLRLHPGTARRFRYVAMALVVAGVLFGLIRFGISVLG